MPANFPFGAAPSPVGTRLGRCFCSTLPASVTTSAVTTNWVNDSGGTSPRHQLGQRRPRRRRLGGLQSRLCRVHRHLSGLLLDPPQATT